MKQIVIISGKGGTGKTSVTASIVSLLKNNNLAIIDADVDASNLYILLKPSIEKEFDFYGGLIAYIDKSRCVKCGKCISVCRFDAIDSEYNISNLCEGCKFCYNVCDFKAIEMKSRFSGKWFVSNTSYGKMFHARLDPGEENSGKLVSKIKEAAKEYSLDKKIDYIIVDGPPGIGCPVMASISGNDIAVIVTEPTLSGISDMERASNVLFTLGIKFFVVINKFDINAENSQKIENICKEKGIEVIGKIPFDENVEKAIALTKPFAESFPDSPASISLKKILEKILKKLD